MSDGAGTDPPCADSGTACAKSGTARAAGSPAGRSSAACPPEREGPAEAGLPSKAPGRASDAGARPTSSRRGAPGCSPSRDATRYATSSSTGIRIARLVVVRRRLFDARPDAVELADRLAPALERAVRLAEARVQRAHLALGALQRRVPLGIPRSEPLDAARPIAPAHGPRHGLEIPARHRLQQPCSSHRLPPSYPGRSGLPCCSLYVRSVFSSGYGNTCLVHFQSATSSIQAITVPRGPVLRPVSGHDRVRRTLLT